MIQMSCCLASWMYSSSTSWSRTLCRKPSTPALIISLASARSNTCPIERSPSLLRLVGRGREHLRRQLGRAAAAVVDPELDEVGLERRKLAHELARLLGAGDRERHVVAGFVGRPRARIGEPAADGEDARGVRDRLVAQLERQIAEVGAGAQHRDDAVIGIALQMVDVIVAREIVLRHACRTPCRGSRDGRARPRCRG